MPLFLAPLPSSSTTRHSQPSNLRKRLSASRPQRKRKHFSSESESSSPSASSSDDDRPDAATNPLSLTPDEIAQYRLAGLTLDKSLPGVTVNGWPHRGLSSVARLDSKAAKRKSKGKEKEKSEGSEPEAEDEAEDEAVEEGQSKENASSLRLHHFAVLTTILHRCLLEGDVKRAGRAWALMLRMQVGGKSVDLRGTNYWGIGAELLIRSMDGTGNRAHDSDSGSEAERGQQDEETEDSQEQRGNEDVRWGTAIGLQRAKDYYERLIIEHPFKRQFSSAVSALDFWPCMVACEIYGVQNEQVSSLRKVQRLEDQDIDYFKLGEVSDNESEEDEEDYDIGDFEAERKRKERRQKKKDEHLWQEKDRIRQIALTAASQIAARLDERLVVPPYSDSHDLLHIRGMLALYIGDLSVPAQPEEHELENEEGRERRLLLRERTSEYERGLRVKEEQWEKARNLFGKIQKDDGDVSGIPEDLLPVVEQDSLMGDSSKE